MNLPKLTDLEVTGKRVLVRADLDFDPQDSENMRFKSLIPTLDYLKEKNAEMILIGKRGRPQGKVDMDLSLKPFEALFTKWGVQVEENLRFDPGEAANDQEFAKNLAEKGDAFVNESFAVSHRAHASLVSLPKLLPHAAGIHFAEEVNNLEKVFKNPRRPVVFLVSGAKEDKLTYLDDLLAFSDKVLVGGLLPTFLGENYENEKVVLGRLSQDKEDLTISSIEKFEAEIAKAGTIIVSGPMGKYEDAGHRQGTERVLTAVAKSGAFKVAGGGDTDAALELFNLTDKFDWVSTGGGAMLEFLTKRTLPGIEALLN